jgi:carboxypeptidase T
MGIKPRLIFIIFITLVFTGSLLLKQGQISIASNQANPQVSIPAQLAQEIVVRFYYDNQEQLDAVAGQLDVWEIHPQPWIGTESGYAVAAMSPAQRDWLQALGYRVELDLEKTASLQSAAEKLDPRYYYFDNYVTNPNARYMVDFLHSITSAYPSLTELIDIGDAWLAGSSGYHRDMWVMRISNEDPNYGDISAKPTFFLMANIHAREVTTPEMAIRYIQYLTSGYQSDGGFGIDPDVTWLVNHHAAYVLVAQNPDGRVVNELDPNAWWRKNVDSDGCSIPGLFGIDLNRNSSFAWGCCGGSSAAPCAETYRGPAPASEPETTAFQAFASTVFKDWNGNNGDFQIALSPDDASGIFITLHSYADDILWPWGFAPGTAPNNAQLQTIGRKLADITGVMVPTGEIGYVVDGSTDDWVYGKLGVAAFTYEIGPNYGPCGSFFPAYGCQDGIDNMPRNFWAELKDSLIYANKIAASPYMTAYGPDTQGLTLTPVIVPYGQLAQVAGMLIDQRYADDALQPVVAAEYFIDAPGEDGTGSAMVPVDGSWGGTRESAEASLDTTGLDIGQHYLLVHAKSDQGAWGPFSAVFFNITPVVKLSLVTPGLVLPGQAVEFSADIMPDNIPKPYSYTVDFGDGNEVAGNSGQDPLLMSHTYERTGSFIMLLTLQVQGLPSPTTATIFLQVGHPFFLPFTRK